MKTQKFPTLFPVSRSGANFLLIALLAVFLCAACGKKGPLYLPKEQVPVSPTAAVK